jgi:hypothetical protein
VLNKALTTVSGYQGEYVGLSGWWSESRLTPLNHQTPNNKQENGNAKASIITKYTRDNQNGNYPTNPGAEDKARAVYYTPQLFRNRILHLHFFIPPLPLPSKDLHLVIPRLGG